MMMGQSLRSDAMLRACCIIVMGMACAVWAEEAPPVLFAPPATKTKEAPTPPAEEPLKPSPEVLKRFQEPPLKDRSDAAKFPSLRLIWIRTFHAPLSFRAFMTKNGPKFRVARMSGKGGYDWGHLSFEKEFPLKADQWKELLKLAAVGGAREPLKTARPEGKAYFDMGLDGSTWTLEVSDKAGYTVEEIWSPTYVTEGADKKMLEDAGVRLDAFVALCKFLMKCAPVDLEPVY